jgi:hypothetical protein
MLFVGTLYKGGNNEYFNCKESIFIFPGSKWGFGNPQWKGDGYLSFLERNSPAKKMGFFATRWVD